MEQMDKKVVVVQEVDVVSTSGERRRRWRKWDLLVEYVVVGVLGVKSLVEHDSEG